MSRAVSKNTPRREALVADLQRLHKDNPAGLTRNFYRENGKFTEREWQSRFPTFAAFLFAAGIQSAHVVTPRPEKEKPVPPETSRIEGDKWELSLPKTRIHTLDELLEYCKVDLAVWQVASFQVNKWEQGSTTGEGKEKKAIIEPLFQVKATLKKRPEVIAARLEIERLKEEAKKFSKYHPPLVRAIPGTGNALVISIPDAHFGKLAWGRETGGPNYDTTIAEQTFLRALETLIKRSAHYKYDKVLFIVGNDLLNSDDLDGHTTKGTLVSTDGRYYKTFGVVRRTITRCIERLRAIAPVKVVMVSGNHDGESVWHLGDSLECYFHQYTDVEIDNEPTARKYHRHGLCFWMWTHGEKGKKSDYPLLMATERPKDFGETKFREAGTGHLHTNQLNEHHGVRVRTYSALCPADVWHADMGYLGNLRSAEASIWNDREGMIAQVYHNEDALEPIETQIVVKEAA